MCGVFGIWGNNNEEAMQALRKGMLNRGPDATGIYEDGHLSIGMSRLHLRGDDSTLLPFKTGGMICSYNGEVYGKISDDYSYLENLQGGIGEVDFIQQNNFNSEFDGMYALAMFDKEKKVLQFKRDRFGIKPLFYNESSAGLTFSSYVKLLDRGAGGREPYNIDALFDSFTYGYPLGADTFFNEIKELPGNGIASISGSSPLIVGKIDSDVPGKDIPLSLKEAIRQSLDSCIKGDYKIGLAVSGGIDSTILAYELNEMGVEDIETFSVILKESGDGIRDLRELGLKPGGAWTTWKHNYTEIDIESFTKYSLESVEQFGLPNDMHSLPLYTALAKLVAGRGLRILLTGEGADELFMGYAKYLNYKGAHTVDKYFLEGAKGNFIKKIFDPEVLQKGIQRGNEYSKGRFWEQIRAVELKCRLQKLLLRTDVVLMEHHIEGRTPFLHGYIPEIAMRSDAAEIRGDHGKKLLRDCYRGMIPGIEDSVKKRFKASEDFFMEVFQQKRMKDLLFREKQADGINLSNAIIERIYDQYTGSNKSDLSELLWLILTTKQAIN